MKKIFWSILICPLLVISLSGCTKNGGITNVIPKDPINELIVGCNDNGEEITKDNEQIIDYYCRDKLYYAIRKSKYIHEKYYNYEAYGYGRNNLLASYKWQGGDYYCNYTWQEGYVPCTAEEFVQNLKEGLNQIQYTHENSQYIESQLLSGCELTEQDNSRYTTFIKEKYICNNKPWKYVTKESDPETYRYIYTPSNDIRAFTSIMWNKGEFKCWGYKLPKYLPCTEDEYIKNLKEEVRQYGHIRY